MATKSKSAGVEKAACPVSKKEFLENAKPIEVMIAGVPTVAMPKIFSTGSFGYFAGGKVTAKVGDTLVQLQVGVNMTVIGSKDLAG